jgi:menaquinol-cytochrome c reductase iron-sulfur subunit
MTDPLDRLATDSRPAFINPIGPRRTFLVRMIQVIPTVMGLSLLFPLFRYVSAPTFSRQADVWTPIAKVADLPIGQPQELEYTSMSKDGWRTTSTKKAVWVIKQADEVITAFSPLCPHLGCGFRWNAPARQFQCPCHGSVFDEAGTVVAGPAPRPLDVLPTKVEDGQLLVLYKEFKSGLTHAVEL